MAKFKKRGLDQAAAMDGAWLDLYFIDEHVGRFLIRFCDTAGNEFRLAILRRNQRLSAADSRRLANPNVEADLDFAHAKSVELLLDNKWLLDWEIEGADGKPVPFTRENAVEFFCDAEFRFAFKAVENFATEEANFRAATTDNIAKN